MPRDRSGPVPRNYKWTALSNTTLGMFMASLDASIVLISLPAIFRGINLDPLTPSNIGYLLWMLMGYLVVTAVLVVTFGRLGDMFGRVRMYNAGFAVFTFASIALSLTPGTGEPAAMWLIVWRVVQGIGGALLMANSTAILTDAFPAERTRPSDGHLDDRGHLWLVHRPHRRRTAGRRRLAAGVLGQRAVRRVRHGLGVRQAARARPAEAHEHRLVGQRHVRGRADHDPRRHHLRPAAGRRPQHGWTSPWVLFELSRWQPCC